MSPGHLAVPMPTAAPSLMLQQPTRRRQPRNCPRGFRAYQQLASHRHRKRPDLQIPGRTRVVTTNLLATAWVHRGSTRPISLKIRRQVSRLSKVHEVSQVSSKLDRGAGTIRSARLVLRCRLAPPGTTTLGVTGRVRRPPGSAVTLRQRTTLLISATTQLHTTGMLCSARCTMRISPPVEGVYP